MPRLIAAALLASLIFAACTAGQGPSTVVAPTAAFQADRSEGMQSQASTRQPEAETTSRPTATPSTATPSTAPEPTVAAESPPTPRIEITLTSIPAPTGIPIAGPIRPGATWRGITVAPEERCSPYDSDNYPYPPSVEPRIVEELGGVYGPYTGTWFGSMKETDIEHSSHPGGHRRQDDVQVKLVDSVMRGKGLLCPQVEDAKNHGRGSRRRPGPRPPRNKGRRTIRCCRPG